MPNVLVNQFPVSDPMADSPNMIAAQLARHDPDTGDDSAYLGGKKRSKKELMPVEEDPELIAVEALAFMCGGNSAAGKAAHSSLSLAPGRLLDTSSVTYLAQSTASITSAPKKRMRISASNADVPTPGSTFVNGVLLASPGTTTSENGAAGNGAMMSMRALTDADRVISGAQNLHSLAQPGLVKRPKSASADIYVPLCRAFARAQMPASQLYGLSGVDNTNPMTPPPLTMEFILNAATNYEHFSPTTIDSWKAALAGHGLSSDASGFVDSLMSSKDTAVKVIFSLMHCALYLQTKEGQLAWKHNYDTFRRTFKDTLLVVIEQDNIRDEAKNQSLIATLPLAYFCIQKLMPRLGLRDNLCLFLALISCLEGRGKYHGRAGDNLPFAHKCYRYLVEVLGGKVFRDIPEKEQSKADKELTKLFEIQTLALLASSAAAQLDLHSLVPQSGVGFQSLFAPVNSHLQNMHVVNHFNNLAAQNLSNAATAKLLLAHRTPYIGLYNPHQQPFLTAQHAATTAFPAVASSGATNVSAISSTNSSTQDLQQLRVTSETFPVMPATS